MKLKVVSLETAKKLKEVGFDIPIHSYYTDGIGIEITNDPVLTDANSDYWKEEKPFIEWYSAPTLALVHMWLMEKHSTYIMLVTRDIDAWAPNLCKLEPLHGYCGAILNAHDVTYKNHDLALEAGILEAIKILPNQ